VCPKVIQWQETSAMAFSRAVLTRPIITYTNRTTAPFK
jgi:hypothetical protein